MPPKKLVRPASSGHPQPLLVLRTRTTSAGHGRAALRPTHGSSSPTPSHHSPSATTPSLPMVPATRVRKHKQRNSFVPHTTHPRISSQEPSVRVTPSTVTGCRTRRVSHGTTCGAAARRAGSVLAWRTSCPHRTSRSGTSHTKRRSSKPPRREARHTASRTRTRRSGIRTCTQR